MVPVFIALSSEKVSEGVVAFWNLMCLAETEMLRPEMMDIPSRDRQVKNTMNGCDFDGDLAVNNESTVNANVNIEPVSGKEILNVFNKGLFGVPDSSANQKGEDNDKSW